MSRLFECPKCGADISETYESWDPDVGIMAAGWYCDTCDEGFIDDSDDSAEYESERSQ